MYTEYNCSYTSLKIFVGNITKYFSRVALGYDVWQRDWTKNKPAWMNKRGVDQINITNPNKYWGKPVICTVVKSENCDIRWSNSETFWDTAGTQNPDTSQCYVIQVRTFQGLIKPSDEDVL